MARVAQAAHGTSHGAGGMMLQQRAHLRLGYLISFEPPPPAGRQKPCLPACLRPRLGYWARARGGQKGRPGKTRRVARYRPGLTTAYRRHLAAVIWNGRPAARTAPIAGRNVKIGEALSLTTYSLASCFRFSRLAGSNARKRTGGMVCQPHMMPSTLIEFGIEAFLDL